MRCLPVLLVCACACALSLSACGDDAPDPLRIAIQTFSFDGPVPSGLVAVRADTPDDVREAYDVVPSSTGMRDLYDIPGAPEGFYRIEGPEGWWMIQLGAAPPELRRGRQPPRVGFGHAYSLYLGALIPNVRPSTRWGVERTVEGAEPETVPTTLVADDLGYAVALRFRPEDYRGTMRAMGYIALGDPPTPEPPGPDAPLAEPFVFVAPENGRPLIKRITQGVSAPLDVVLVSAGAGVEVDGLGVRAGFDTLPIEFEVATLCRDGIARFTNLAAVDRTLLLRVGANPFGHRVSFAQRRGQAGVRVLVSGELPQRAVSVTVGDGVDVDLVQARPAAAVAYGRVAFERVGDAIVFSVPPGPFSALLRAGSTWAEAEGDGDGDLEIPEAAFHEAVAVGGRVHEARPGSVVRFFRQVGDGAVLADGFELLVRAGGDFEGALPMGRYAVEVASPTGTWRRPAPVVAESPGARLHLPLQGR